MIACHRQRIRQTSKHRLTVVFNAGRFAVQDLSGLANITAVGLDNGLMTEADTDNRQFTAHTGQKFWHTACFAWRTRARREHQHRVLHGGQTLN